MNQGRKKGKRCGVSRLLVFLAATLILAGFQVGAGASSESPTVVEAEAGVPETPEQGDKSAEASETPEPAVEAGERELLEESPKPRWIRGQFEMGVDLARSREDSDVRTDQYFRLEVRPPEHERLRFRGALWLREDLDAGERYSSALRTINDASGSSVQARLLYLYLEADDVWGDSTLRIGRQRILESPAYNRVDGLYFKQRHGLWDWYAFGGVRASVYTDAHENPVFGGGGSIFLPIHMRITLDAFYGEDHRDKSDEVYPGLIADLIGLGFPRRVKREIDSRMIALSITQHLTPRHTLHGRYTWYGGTSDELLISATGFLTSREVVYELTYRRRLNELRDRANDLTGYYRVLGAQEESDDFLAALHIPLNEQFTLSLEGQIHEVENDSPYTANRDYRRAAAILSASSLFHGVDAGIGLENWDVQDGEGTWAFTGEVSKSWERVKVTLGADYERYQDRIVRYRPEVSLANTLLVYLVPGVYPASYYPWVDLFDTEVVETHENIYSIYARIDYKVAENQDILAQVTFEEDDGPDSPYWWVRAMYTVRF